MPLLDALRSLLTGTAHDSAGPPPWAARDPFAHGLFPVCVATHDHGLRWLFDLAAALLLLDCRPGDRVLDLGAGSGFSSEMLARFGYDVVAIDPDRAALANNRRRPSYDRSRIDGTVRVAGAVAERLPLATASVDGVVCLNVLHHVPDLPAATAELARVVKPGCRVVFSEPGLEHLQSAETQRAIREHGEGDRAFDVIDFLRAARTHGFAHTLLAATLQPPLRLLPIDDLDSYLADRHPHPPLTNRGVVDELRQRHAYGVLVRAGARARTSRYPGALRASIDVEGLPPVLRRGEPRTVTVRVRNLGDTHWLSAPSNRGGFVTVGCKLLAGDGRLVTDMLGRTCLPADVAPGGTAEVSVRLTAPRAIARGGYELRVDLVDEFICWFSDLPDNVPYAAAVSIE